jgi:putative transcriptional regulator
MTPTIEKNTEVRLLEMMAKKNIRQIKELHELTGLSRTIISDLLNGNKRSIQLDTIAKLCMALDCEINDLIVIKK